MISERRSAFTLLELMIVVAVIAVVAAVAIPSLQNSRKSAVEAKAIGLMRTAVTVNEQYRVRFGVYAPTGNELAATGYIPDFSSYLTEYSIEFVSTGSSWEMRMNPTAPGQSADRYFFVNSTGVIRFSSVGPADQTSPPIQ